MITLKTLKYKILTEKEVDKAIETIQKLCKNENSYPVIKRIINRAFFNQLLLGQKMHGVKGFKVYRVTTPYTDGFDLFKVKTFSYPEKPKRGRANLEDFPVFYCSLNPNTALTESRIMNTDEQSCYVSEWVIDFTKLIYVKTLLFNSTTVSDDFYTNALVKDNIESVFNGDVLAGQSKRDKEKLRYFLLKLGDLFTLDKTDTDNYYNITSAYAHSLLYDMKKKNKSLFFSMLSYPSVPSKHRGINLAIHPHVIEDGMMKCKRVLKVKVSKLDKEGSSSIIESVGIPNDEGDLVWYKRKISAQIIPHTLKLSTSNGISVLNDEALSLAIEGENLSIKEVFLRQLDMTIEDYVKKNNLVVSDFSFPIETTQSVLSISQKYTGQCLVKSKYGLTNVSEITADVLLVEHYEATN